MSGSTDLLGHCRQRDSTSHSLKVFLLQKFLGYGKKVYGDMFIDKFDHSLIYHSVFRLVEAARSKFLHSFIHAARFNQQSAQYSFLEINGLRWFVTHLEAKSVQIDFLFLRSGTFLRLRHDTLSPSFTPCRRFRH